MMNPSMPTVPTVQLESSRALPLVSLCIVLEGGAALDPTGQGGLCCTTSRLLRRTGGGLLPHVLAARIDSLGASLSLEATHDHVLVHGTVIARSLDPFIDLVIDVLARPSLDETEFERLKREAESELIEQRDSDQALAQRFFRRALYAGHLYGQAIDGTIGSTKAQSYESAQTLYRHMVRSGQSTISFAGDIDRPRADAVAKKLADALPGSARAVQVLAEPDDTIPGRHLLIVDKPERSQCQILIGCLGSHPSDPEHTALHVANTVFGGTFTARLTQEVRAKRGWSYGASSSLSYARTRRSFSMWTFPKSTDAAACVQLQLELLKKWIEDGVIDNELASAKNYLIRSHAFAVDTPSKRASLKLDTSLYGLPENYHSEYLQRVANVDTRRANEAIRKRISDRDLLITVVGTASDIEAPLGRAIEDLTSVEVLPFDGDI